MQKREKGMKVVLWSMDSDVKNSAVSTKKIKSAVKLEQTLEVVLDLYSKQ